MKYVTLTNLQLFIMTVLTGAIAGAILILFTMYQDWRILPQVLQTPVGECIKVVNFENGHAFSCPDVNVLLRRYRVVKDAPQ